MHHHVAEDVLPGHPDRLADAVAESIVDHALTRDPDALVGVEVGVSTDKVFITGRMAFIDRGIGQLGLAANNGSASGLNAETYAQMQLKDISEIPKLDFRHLACEERLAEAGSSRITKGIQPSLD